MKVYTILRDTYDWHGIMAICATEEIANRMLGIEIEKARTRCAAALNKALSTPLEGRRYWPQFTDKELIDYWKKEEREAVDEYSIEEDELIDK